MHPIGAGLPGSHQKTPLEDISSAPVSGRRAADPPFAELPQIAWRADWKSPPERPRRPLPPELLRGPAVAAAVRQPGIAARVQEMKDYLAEMRLAHEKGRELLSRDAEFLDLLVAAENDRNRSLRLSAHTVDPAVLGEDWDAVLKATADLARTAMEGMAHGTWHAVVSILGHEVALSASHDPKHPSRLTWVVVDSFKKYLDSRAWKQISGAVCHHMKNALGMEDKPADAKVWVSCLNTSTQITKEGGAIFALTAVRNMPNDADVEKLHADMHLAQASDTACAAARVFENNRYLGARFFKLMAQKPSMDELLASRPELKDVPVNQKGNTLRTYLSAHLVSHQSPHGLIYRYNNAYEKKRLGAYERLIEHIEIAAGPQSSPERESASKTATIAWPPVQQGTHEFPQPPDLTVRSSFNNNPDFDEKSPIHSEDTFKPVGTAPHRRDRSEFGAQRSSDDKSSRHTGRGSDRRRSQDEDELTDRSGSVGSSRRESRSYDKAGMKSSSYDAQRGREAGPDVTHMQGVPYRPGPAEGGEYLEDTCKPEDGTAPPRRNRSELSSARDADRESSRHTGTRSERRRSQNDDELTDRSGSVGSGRSESRSHGKARMKSSPYDADVTHVRPPPAPQHVQFQRTPYQVAPYRPGPAQGGGEFSEATFKPVDGTAPPRRDRSELRAQQNSDGESSRHTGGRSHRRRSQEDNELTDRPGSVGPRSPRVEVARQSAGSDYSEDTFEPVDGTASPRRDRSELSSPRDSDGKSSRHTGRRSDRRRSQDDDELTNHSGSVGPGRRDSRSYKAPMESSSYFVQRRPAAGPDVTHMRHPPAPQHVQFERVPYQRVPYRPAMAEGGEYQPAGNHRAGLFGPDVMHVRPPPVPQHVQFEQAPYPGVRYRPGLGEGGEYQPARDHRAGLFGPDVMHMRPPPVPQHVQFEQAPYQGIRYRPGLAQGGEYQPAGDHRAGFSGPTVVPQGTPVLHALLTKLHETTISANANFSPRPSFLRQPSSSLKEEVARRGTLFDYSMPLYGDHMVHESFIRLDAERRHADNLRALKTRYSIRVDNEYLNSLVRLAKTVSQTTYDDLLNIARMMFRQEVINGLAERVALANRQENEKNHDKSAPYQVEDAHVIALVYQAVVAAELQILPMQDVHRELTTNDAFKSVFASVIVPDQLEYISHMIKKEVRAEEQKEAKFDDFLNAQAFWVTYQEEYKGIAIRNWEAKYPRTS